MPVPLIALKLHRYAGRVLQAGDTFSARTRDDARVLKSLGRAKDAPATASPVQVAPVRTVKAPLVADVPPTPEPEPTPLVVGHHYETAEMQVEPEVPTEPETEPETIPAVDEEATPTPRPRRHYKRRDLTAED